MVDFAPNEMFFFAILVHYGSKSGILLKIDFAPNKTFFPYWYIMVAKLGFW
jgi:hypothetical protein